MISGGGEEWDRARVWQPKCVVGRRVEVHAVFTGRGGGFDGPQPRLWQRVNRQTMQSKTVRNRLWIYDGFSCALLHMMWLNCANRLSFSMQTCLNCTLNRSIACPDLMDLSQSFSAESDDARPIPDKVPGKSCIHSVNWHKGCHRI